MKQQQEKRKNRRARLKKGKAYYALYVFYCSGCRYNLNLQELRIWEKCSIQFPRYANVVIGRRRSAVSFQIIHKCNHTHTHMKNETHKTYIEMDTRMSWGKDTTGQKLQHSDFQGPNNASSTNAQHTKSTVKRQILSIIDLDWLVSVFIVMSKNHIDFSHRSYNRSLLFCYRVFLSLFSAVWQWDAFKCTKKSSYFSDPKSNSLPTIQHIIQNWVI